MSSEIIRQYEMQYMKKDIPEFRAGDTVRVSVKISEGDKERIQEYEGFVMKRKGGGLRETFTVRRISGGVGMERTFPLHSPKIDKITVIRRGRVRRAKLYYMRDLRGKAARITEVKETAQQAAARVAAKTVRKAAAKVVKAEKAANKAANKAAAEKA